MVGKKSTMDETQLKSQYDLSIHFSTRKIHLQMIFTGRRTMKCCTDCCFSSRTLRERILHGGPAQEGMIAGVLDRNVQVGGNCHVGESERGLWLHKNLTLGSGPSDIASQLLERPVQREVL